MGKVINLTEEVGIGDSDHRRILIQHFDEIGNIGTTTIAHNFGVVALMISANNSTILRVNGGTEDDLAAFMATDFQGHGYGFVEFARRLGDFAIVSAAALLELGPSSEIKRASFALGGVGYAPLRMKEIETGLVGRKATTELWAEAAKACCSINTPDDVHASSAYRRRLAVAMARRALQTAGERALATLQSH